MLVMNHARAKQLAKMALLGIVLGATACDEPAKSAADAQDGGASTREGTDRAGSGDKSHCGGDGK